MKTEFLIRLDGCATAADERVLVVGATNRPQELDDAARRRLVKRLYIPLPDQRGRTALLRTLLGKAKHDINDEQIEAIGRRCQGNDAITLTLAPSQPRMLNHACVSVYRLFGC
jgi:SpoVK/Ycf46/Vps4 family AAA+-type ATPase